MFGQYSLPVVTSLAEKLMLGQTLNVQRPSGTSSASKLPVVFWIFGGGFEFGSTQSYDATNFIGKSVSLGKPVIYVAVNYRLDTNSLSSSSC